MLTILAQVASVITLTAGQATTIVRNPSPTETLRVTVALHHATQAASTVTMAREVTALVAPATFTLAPHEQQTVRIRLRENVPAGTVLRLLTCFTPADADKAVPGSDTSAVARLVLRTCINGKVRVT